MLAAPRLSVLPACLLALALTSPALHAAEEGNAKDPPFKLHCEGRSVKFLPKGNAAVGTVKFDVEADPGTQKVSMDGDKKSPAGIDKFEVWFHAADGADVSISRTRHTFALVKNLGSHGGDSRLYILHEGVCKPL